MSKNHEKPREEGSEFFYRDSKGKKQDAALHEGNEEGEKAVGELAQAAARKRGLSEAQVQQLYGGTE